jgi:hypothetical protein
MRKLFKERKLFKGGNYMRKYGIYVQFPVLKESLGSGFFFLMICMVIVTN